MGAIDGIVPRWEWRAFGDSFGEGEEKLTALDCSRFVESSEVYLLSPLSDGNVKIRGGALDVKILREVNADRLERWSPVMKEPFPLAAGVVDALFQALSLPPRPFRDAVYDEEAFLSGMTGAAGPFRVVPVSKRRWGYLYKGAILERAELDVAGGVVKTVCVEHADAGIVLSLVKEFGFIEFENTSYVALLKRLNFGRRSR